MTKDKLLVYISALVLTLIVLRLIPENFDLRFGPVKVLSLELWIGVFVFFTFIYRSRAMLGSEMLWAYAYAMIVIVMDIMGHLVASSSVWLSAQVRPFLLSLIMYRVFDLTSDHDTKKRFMLFVTAIIGLSCLINIVGLIRYPLAVRYIVGGGEGAEGRDFYSSIGISNYGFFSSLPMIIPVCFYALRRSCSSTQKWLFGLTIVLIIWALFLSTITTPILIAVSSLFLSLFGITMKRRIYAIMVVVILTFVSFIIPPQQVFNYAIEGLINIAPSSDVRRRLNDVKIASEEGVEVTSTGRTETTVEHRLQRVFWNLETFSKHPVIGSSANNSPEAFHLFWLYFLASMGLVGIFPFFAAALVHVRSNRNRFNKEFWYYYLLSILGFAVSGMLKNVTGWFMYLVPFFIVPSMFYIENTHTNKVQSVD